MPDIVQCDTISPTDHAGDVLVLKHLSLTAIHVTSLYSTVSCDNIIHLCPEYQPCHLGVSNLSKGSEEASEQGSGQRVGCGAASGVYNLSKGSEEGSERGLGQRVG